MKVSIIIVNYNVCYFVEQALKSAQKAIEGIEAEIFVVDNNSVDNSVDHIRREFPEVKLIANKDNVGFSRANNQAIKEARGEYVLLLNPDTVVEEDTIKKCVDFMDAHPDGGGLGVKMVDGSGIYLPESKRGLPTPWVAFYKISGLASLFPKSKKFGRYHMGYLGEDETSEIEILAGAFMFMRSKTLDEVGLLDEDYFMYGEDIDLSYRITKGGYKNYYLPETRIIHYKGESTKKTSINYVFIFYRAMIIFARKHFSQKNAWAFTAIINVAIYLKAGVDISLNFLRRSALYAADMAMSYGALYALSKYWENSYRPGGTAFQPVYYTTILPAYAVVWGLSNYFSGGTDQPYRVGKIARGILVGTLLISAISNFGDGLRYSKAIIVMGGAATLLVFILNRYIEHFIKEGSFKLSAEEIKRVAIVGSPDESSRVMALLKSLSTSVHPVGYISPSGDDVKKDLCIGTLDQINESVKIHNINEIIFCSKDIGTNEIIEFMTGTAPKSVDFKIVPTDSDYIIGSNSKDEQGDLYTIEIKLNITQKHSLRNKRVFDLSFATICLLTLIVNIWLVKNPKGYLKNIFQVFFGKKSWVGFALRDDITLPSLRNGVLSPSSANDYPVTDEKIGRQLDLLYAKDYSVYTDIQIIKKAYRLLGS
jgi:GT2 family glycosyltransferase